MKMARRRFMSMRPGTTTVALELPFLSEEQPAAAVFAEPRAMDAGGVVTRDAEGFRLVRVRTVAERAVHDNDPDMGFVLGTVAGTALAEVSRHHAADFGFDFGNPRLMPFRRLSEQLNAPLLMASSQKLLRSTGRVMIFHESQFRLGRTVYRCTVGREAYDAADFVRLGGRCPEHPPNGRLVA